ncbi:MAG: SH3 domain-containing protein [Thiovulaceae bacterium]|nr:SH3 domain-containing protein [Sulfurimonadaceae bacterium]MDD3816599.1 SH3 domain-containing protein [Sulfurimonadaceae bacterium]
MRYLGFICIGALFLACSPKQVEPPLQSREIHDLVNLPQSVEAYVGSLKEENKVDLQTREERYAKYYFSVWNLSKPRESLEALQWPFKAYTTHNSYGENLQPIEEEFFASMRKNANFQAYGSENKNAITLGYCNIRLFPTNRPVFKDPSLAGEGFPFDYLQNSSIAPNEPLFVSHFSEDREWVYIFSNFASGWIQTKEMVFLEQQYTNEIQKAQQIFITKEDIALHDQEGHFLFRSRIGMSLSLIREDEDFYTVLAIKSSKNAQPLFVQTQISKEIAHKSILPFTKQNLTLIVNEVAQSKYGWGGLFEQRDCSSMLRDIFAPFGMWLPRNSYLQSKVGQVLSLEGLTPEEKIQRIKEKAEPFKTLLYKKGHIVLYVGTYNDTIIVLHNTWGIKTKKEEEEGRIVIGKTVFSTLRLGKEQKHYNEEEDMLRNLKSMNTLPL